MPSLPPSGAAAPAPGAPERYRDNVARHLIGVSRDLESRVMHALSEEHGYGGLRRSFGPLLSLIWLEGRPLTAIAHDLGISRQACSQLATLVERAGYLARDPNPVDRRSKLVRLTPRGRALVEDAVRTILVSDSEYAGRVGAEAYAEFTAALAALYRGLGIPTHADPAPSKSADRSIGVLPLVAVEIQRRLMEATIARGHPGLKMSHGQVLPLIGPNGARIHEIARVQRVSRQAISITAQDLASLGYLRRDPDPDDARGAVFSLTVRGRRLIADSVAALDELEAAFEDLLGSSGLADLSRVARDLYHALHLEAEIFEPQSVEQLARRLRQQLGRDDAAQLASLLEPRPRRSVA